MECDEMRVEQALENLRKNAELEEKNVRVKEQATTDALKGLANRACFDAFMCEQFDAIAPGKPLTMLMFDLDKFKSICDAYGHCTGDEVIQRVAVVLITASRYQDMCPPSSLAAAGRYGREEMFLILPGTTRATGARIADTIRRAVALETVEAGEQTIRITVSVGVATAEWGGRLTTPAHLIKAADLAIDAAKHEGGNCVKVCALPANPPAEDQAVGVDPRMDQDAEAVGNASPPNFAKA
jgi:diguanylate cyclase (GGDEF)-like protein